MVFPPFVLEEGKTFFPMYKCSPDPKAITFKMCCPTQIRVASYFSSLGTASINCEGLSLQVQSLLPTTSIGKERGEFGPAFIVRVLLINHSQQLAFKKQDTLRAWMESQGEQENVSVTLQLWLINNRILTMGI